MATGVDNPSAILAVAGEEPVESPLRHFPPPALIPTPRLLNVEKYQNLLSKICYISLSF